MYLTDILEGIEYECDTDINGIDIENVTSDKNKIGDRTLFVLVKGINFDTGKIIEYIIARRPCAIVCDYDRQIECNIPTVRVSDARRTLAHLCSRFFGVDYTATKFIGVTGTNGKTTTATMIYEIMKHAGYKCGFIGTGKIELAGKVLTDKVYSMTTPDPELLYKSIAKMQDEGCEVVVMEVSSHALALGKVAPITFSHSVFTNLSPEHLDFHGDMENYYNAKLSIFRQSENGIFNADDEYSARALRECAEICNTSSIGILWDADAMARDLITYDLSGSSYIYREPNLIFKVKLTPPGYYNIYNSLLALKCAISFGVRPCVAKEAINSIEGIDGRLEVIHDDITVIIDYAHTEKAFENVLKTVNSAKRTRQRLITVFGCGGDRDKAKRPKMASVAEQFSDLVIVTQDNPRTENENEIISDILEGFTALEKRRVITSRKNAITNAVLSADDGDIVIVLGKGHERYNIDKNGYHDYDERLIIKEALDKRRAVRVKI